MDTFSRFTNLAESLPPTVPFVGPETQERAAGKPYIARLGANELGFGPAPSVLAAIQAAAPLIWRYGDPENHDLKQALSAHLGLSTGQITVGEGIDGMLGVIARLVVTPRTPVVTSLGAYPTFNYHVAGFGGRLITVPYRDDHEDLVGLLEAVRAENAPLVYLANPDNPMGTWHAADAIVEFAKALPETTLLLLDEAYCEFAPERAIPSIDVLSEMPNVIRLRTFSKAYGMAGLRTGYAFGTSGTISRFDRVRNHFGVNRLGQAAALAALADTDWLEHVKGQVQISISRLEKIATANGLESLPSATNFLAVDCGGPARAKAVLEALGKAGIFIRMPAVSPLNRCIRVSAGPESEIDAFEAALPGLL